MKLFRRAILAFALIVGMAPAIAQVPPPVPALPDAERRVSYSITGSTCACSLGANLALYGDSTDFQNWVEVWLNGVQVQYNDPVFGWTITSQSTTPLANLARPITDGVLTFTNAQTGTVQIVGAERPRRTSTFSENQPVPARNINLALNYIIASLREVWDKINDVTGRGIFGVPGEDIQSLQPAATRANGIMCWDATGLIPLVCVTPPTGSLSAGTGIQFTGSNPSSINLKPAQPSTIGGVESITCPAGQAVGVIPTTSVAPTCVANGSITIGSQVNGAGTTYASAQCNTVVGRFNSGAAMVDTLPGTGAGILPANCVFSIFNNDTSILALSVASGAAFQSSALAFNGFIYVGPGQTIRIQSNGSNYFPLDVSPRIKLAANTSILISTTGNDSTGNGITTAFASLSKAWSFAQTILDHNGFVVTYSYATGNYAVNTTLTGPQVGSCGAACDIIQGNTGAPVNVTIGAATGVSLTIDGAQAQLQGVEFNFITGQQLVVTNNAVLNWQNNITQGTSTGASLTAVSGGVLRIIGSYQVGTVASASTPVHWNANNGGRIAIEATGVTITVVGGPAWGSEFAFAQTSGSIFFDFVPTFSGSSTGTSCAAVFNGVINTAGHISSLPGSGACAAAATGGQTG